MADNVSIVEFEDAVVEIGAQAIHAGQGISDGGRERGFARDRGELQGQPDLQIVEEAMSSIPGKLMAQLLDQDRLRLDLGQQPRGEAAQLLGVFGQGQGVIQHAGSLSHCIPCGNH